MDSQLEQMLQEEMRSETEWIPLPEDILARGVSRATRRRIVRRRLVAGGSAAALIAVAVGLVFGVTAAHGGDKPDSSQAVASTSAPTTRAVTSATTKDGKLTVTFVNKTLSTMTLEEGEILHIKGTSVEHKFGQTQTYIEEYWSTNGPKWKSRELLEMRGATNDKAEFYGDYTGIAQAYTASANVISKTYSEISKKLGSGAADRYEGLTGGYRRLIQDVRESSPGTTIQVGHQQMDGRSVVRITQTPADRKGTYVYFVDEETGVLVEVWDRANGDNQVIHYDLIEKLPATEENLKFLEMTPHPGATIEWSSPDA